MMWTRLLTALVLFLGVAPCPAGAEEVRPHVLEAALWSGFALPLGGSDAETRGGPAVGLQVRYRSPSGLGAFVEGGYASLFTSNGRVSSPGSGSTVPLSSSLDTGMVLGGLGVDVWRIRLEGGLGLAVLSVHSTLNGVTISPRQLDLVYTVAATGFIHDDIVRMGVGVRALFISANDINFLVFTLNFGGDLLRRR